MGDRIDLFAFDSMQYAQADKTAVDLLGDKHPLTRDDVHNMLMVAGFTPGIGNIADAADAVMYVAEGKFGSAGLSAAALIPVIGQWVSAKRVLKAAKKSGKEMVTVYRGVQGTHDPHTMVKSNNIVGNWWSKQKGTYGRKKVVDGVERVEFDGISVPYKNDPKVGIMMEASIPSNVPLDNLMFTTTKFDYAEGYAKNYLDKVTGKKTIGMVLEFEVPKSYINKNARHISGRKLPSGGLDQLKKGNYYWDQHPNLVFTDGLPIDFLKTVHKQ